MSHTYTFGKNSSCRDFKRICKIIVKDCPGYALSERESIEGKTDTVRLTNGKTEIRAEFERDKGTVMVYSDEPLPNLYKLSKRWETAGGIRRKLCFFGYIFTGSPARVKFILLPLLLFSAAFLGGFWSGFAKDGSAASGALTGLSVILTAFKDFLMNWAFFGWAWLIPAGAALNALANCREKSTENKRELSGEKTKGLPQKPGAFINRKADIPILTGLAALPVLGVCYASCRFSVYVRLRFEASIIKSDPLYAPLAVFMAALPYLIIGETVFSEMAKRKKRPYADAAAITGICSVTAALAAAVIFSDISTGLENNSYETKAELAELISAEYADELNDIAEYALANNCLYWKECPDESLEKQWEKIFLEGRAEYRVNAKGNSIVFYIQDTKCSVTPNAEGDDADEH